MAPTASEHGIPINTKTVAAIIIIIAAAVWLMLSNMPPAPAPREQPKVIRINATTPAPPAQQPPAQQITSMFMCRGEAYMTRSGLVICGVEMVTDQYVFIRRGWIYAPNSTQFALLGDVSACRLSVSVNMLHLNCTAPIMVAR